MTKAGLKIKKLNRLVLGCIEAKFCKQILVGKLSPRSTQCTPLHRSLISIFSLKIAEVFAEFFAEFFCKNLQKEKAKFSAIFNENFAIRERCKGVHCVDLGESFPTSIYLQNLASIQPRTSPEVLKFELSEF